MMLLWSSPLFFGLLTLVLGKDANGDLRNHQFYHGYAILDGRFGFDLGLSQATILTNPLIDVPFYWAAQHWPAPLVGFLLGSIEGLPFLLLFLLAHRLLRIEPAGAKVWASAAIALVGMLGGVGLGILGTTLYDGVSGIGVLGATLLALSWQTRLTAAAAPCAIGLAVITGLPAGVAIGLWPSAAIGGIGLSGALLTLPASPGRRVTLALSYGAGLLIGAAGAAAPWIGTLWDAAGPALLVHRSGIAGSATLAEGLLFPFLFAVDPGRIAGVPWRDFRVPLLYVLLPAAVMTRHLLAPRRDATPPIADPVGARFVLTLMALSYLGWVLLWSTQRSLIVMEMLAPLAIVLAVGLFPGSRRARIVAAAALLAAVQGTTQAACWGRRPWDERWVAVEVPLIQAPERTMILIADGGGGSFSHVLPFFDPRIPFVRIAVTAAAAPAAAALARIAAHHGYVLMLSTIPETALAATVAARYGFTLDPTTCQLVRDNLMEPLNLCPLHRRGPLLSALP